MRRLCPFNHPPSSEGKATVMAEKSDSDKKGLHDGPVREVRVDDYPERTYKDAMTDEQREALKEAGLL